ncbi:MAG: hypothetical protein PHO28_04355 [Candidatus Pacebacteria bacterium]|nr:hypothetical protein [Candidatus Paceibacterota bacterium]
MAANISQAFSEFKSRLELNDALQDAVTTHHKAIRNWIESYKPDIETQIIGSLQRKTRIQPRVGDIFDIDILVILGNFHSWTLSSQGVSPDEALNEVDKIMREHEGYEKIDPEKDFPTVIINYADDTKAELVPAYRDFINEPKGRGYCIPKSYNEWRIADYNYDANYISKKNYESDEWLIPTIKMLKAAKRNLFPEMKSYHLEVLATSLISLLVAYYKSQNLQFSFPGLIYGFFLLAKDDILKSCSITGSKSPDASAYIGNFQKQNLADKFGKIANYCQNIIQLDGRDVIEKWKKIFGDPFPSYG